jgi:hypothetical protein
VALNTKNQIKSNQNKAFLICCHFRVAITMSVSAFWHGIHPGYYLSFMLVPVIVYAEDLMIARFRKQAIFQLYHGDQF